MPVARRDREKALPSNLALRLPRPHGVVCPMPVVPGEPAGAPAPAEVTAVDGAERGDGPCAVCACGIEAVALGWPSEANGLSLKRDVSELQAVTPAAISASTAARGNGRERNISATP